MLSYAPHRDVGEKMKQVFEVDVARFLVAEICMALGEFFFKFGVKCFKTYLNYIVFDSPHLRLYSFSWNIAQRREARKLVGPR